MITRTIFTKVVKELVGNKAIILVGPRQVGKTTFLNQIMDNLSGTLLLNCDEPDVKQMLTNATSADLKNIIGNSRIVLIDEAQRVKNIGLTLKLLVDNFKNTKVIVSGSPALEMANEINEPLTEGKLNIPCSHCPRKK